jgi:hypothetical protein
MCPASSAMGAVILGTDWGDGSFTDVAYGSPSTGLAYVTPFLYAGGLLDSPTIIDTTTLLSYGYSVSGEGTNRMEVTYSISNDDVVNISDTFGELRFIVDVDPNGNLGADPLGFNDTPSVQWGAASSGDPDQYQVAEFDFITGLQDSIYSNNGLNGTDTCPGGVCDVEFGLQWNLTSLAPGQTWNITIGLADDGSILSTRYLQATSADGPDTTLTFSGVATVVPVPASIYLLGSGLMALLGIGRRRRVLNSQE